jgi:hypothetical protein
VNSTMTLTGISTRSAVLSSRNRPFLTRDALPRDNTAIVHSPL